MNRLGFQKASSGAAWKMDSRCQTGTRRSGGKAITVGDRPWRRAMSQVLLFDCAFLSALCIDPTLHHGWLLVPLVDPSHACYRQMAFPIGSGCLRESMPILPTSRAALQG